MVKTLFDKGVKEFKTQGALLKKTKGGSSFKWISSMLWCLLRYGASPTDYVRFEFDKKSGRERNRYLTILRYFRNIKKFGAGKEGITGKDSEYKTFSKFIKRDYLIVKNDSMPQDIRNFIETHNSVIVKPVRGEQGHGVLKIEKGAYGFWRELENKFQTSGFIIEECITNCKELSIVNPSSLNTIRVTTLSDTNNNVEIISIILRAGVTGAYVDNWGAGGIGYNFDIRTGICNTYGKDKQNNKYLYHPGTNIQMIGFKLPRFEDLKKYVLELTQVYPEARYVGWDIAITPTGFDLIEMNCPAGHDMFQCFDNPIFDKMRKSR